MRQREKRQLVFVLPDGKEHFADLESFLEDWKVEYQREAQTVVTKSGLTTPRDQPKTVQVKVKVYQLVINKGVLERRSCVIVMVDVPLARMTEKDYATEMNNVLADLPAAFHGFVRSYADRQGHAYGYEEMVSIAHSLTSELLPSVNAYTKEWQDERMAREVSTQS